MVALEFLDITRGQKGNEFTVNSQLEYSILCYGASEVCHMYSLTNQLSGKVHLITSKAYV